MPRRCCERSTYAAPDGGTAVVVFAAVELTLAELGADIERGVAVTAALDAYEHTQVA